MKFPRVRFTEWSLLVGVVTLAVALGGTMLGRLRAGYRESAIFYADLSRDLRKLATNPGDPFRCGMAEGPTPTPETTSRLADYYGALSRKYDYAAARPWLSVGPDPPRPQ